jgi:hypothetical protein
MDAEHVAPPELGSMCLRVGYKHPAPPELSLINSGLTLK